MSAELRSRPVSNSEAGLLMEWLRKVIRDNSVLENVIALVIAVALCAGAFMVLLATIKVSGLLSETVASWVQAIGAIASIWGTYAVARYQFRVQQNSAADERAALLESRWELVRAVAYDCMEALGEARLHAMDHFGNGVFRLRPGRLEDCQYAIRGLVQQPLPPGAIEIVLDLQKAISRTLLDVQTWYMREAKCPLDSEQFYNMTRRILRAQDDVEKLQGWRQYWYARQRRDPSSCAP